MEVRPCFFISMYAMLHVHGNLVQLGTVCIFHQPAIINMTVRYSPLYGILVYQTIQWFMGLSHGCNCTAYIPASSHCPCHSHLILYTSPSPSLLPMSISLSFRTFQQTSASHLFHACLPSLPPPLLPPAFCLALDSWFRCFRRRAWKRLWRHF